MPPSRRLNPVARFTGRREHGTSRHLLIGERFTDRARGLRRSVLYNHHATLISSQHPRCGAFCCCRYAASFRIADQFSIDRNLHIVSDYEPATFQYSIPG